MCAIARTTYKIIQAALVKLLYNASMLKDFELNYRIEKSASMCWSRITNVRHNAEFKFKRTHFVLTALVLE